MSASEISLLGRPIVMGDTSRISATTSGTWEFAENPLPGRQTENKKIDNFPIVKMGKKCKIVELP